MGAGRIKLASNCKGKLSSYSTQLQASMYSYLLEYIPKLAPHWAYLDFTDQSLHCQMHFKIPGSALKIKLTMAFVL